MVNIGSDYVSLRIERDGDVSTMVAQYGDYAVAFEAMAAVLCLDALGIDLVV